MRVVTRCAVTLIVGITSGTAMEVIMGDLFVGLQTGPGSTSMTVENGTRNDTVEEDPAWSVGLRAGGRKKIFARPGASVAPIIGAEILLNQASYQPGSSDTRVGVAVAPGITWSCTDRVSLLLQGVLGIGRERFALGETSSNSSQTLSGTYRQMAIRGGVTYSLSPYYVVGFELEWGKAPGTLSGDGLNLEVEPHGLSGGLLLLWRLDPYPTPLE